jgi:hypothetical protein
MPIKNQLAGANQQYAAMAPMQSSALVSHNLIAM